MCAREPAALSKAQIDAIMTLFLDCQGGPWKREVRTLQAPVTQACSAPRPKAPPRKRPRETAIGDSTSSALVALAPARLTKLGTPDKRCVVDPVRPLEFRTPRLRAAEELRAMRKSKMPCIPAKDFAKLVQSMVAQLGKSKYDIDDAAISSLHTVAEEYIVSGLRLANEMAQTTRKSRGRQSDIKKSDMMFAFQQLVGPAVQT
mgnify:CR=1 FL=1